MAIELRQRNVQIDAHGDASEVLHGRLAVDHAAAGGDDAV
jgi:hypothetical protein